MVGQNTANNWMKNEFSHVNFGDSRLDMRLQKVAQSLEKNPEASINQAISDWHQAKAAYRLFKNKRFDHNEIIDSHAHETYKRIKGKKRVFALQDTSELDFDTHIKTKNLGSVSKAYKKHKSGILYHPVMAVDDDNVPLGLLGQSYWIRPYREETEQERMHRKYSLPVDKKESIKWINSLYQTIENTPSGTEIISVADRECDFYEFMNLSIDLGTTFVVRSRINRRILSSPNKTKEYLWENLSREKVIKKKVVNIVGNGSRKSRKAQVSLKYLNVEIPIRRCLKSAPVKSKYASKESLNIHAIEVKEDRPPNNEEALHWTLLTNEVVNESNIEEVVSWYEKRWMIEEYFKVLKSGCRVESSCLGEKQRLINFISIKSVIALKIFSLCKLMRAKPESNCEIIFTQEEAYILYKRFNNGKKPKGIIKLYEAGVWLAKLGGYLNRSNDPPPGVVVLWRGLRKLNEFITFRKLMH